MIFWRGGSKPWQERWVGVVEKCSHTTPLLVLNVFDIVILWYGEVGQSVEDSDDTTPLHFLNVFDIVILWYGEVAEWSNAAVLKTVASQGAVSSNLTLSASIFLRAIAKCCKS